MAEGHRETMKLGQLVTEMSHSEISGDPEQPIDGLAYDSRQVKPGYLFVALEAILETVTIISWMPLKKGR